MYTENLLCIEDLMCREDSLYIEDPLYIRMQKRICWFRNEVPGGTVGADGICQ